MVDCAAAGVPPHAFYGLTLGEIWVVVEGAQKRQKDDLIGRVVACVRALGQAFGGRPALQGLVDEPAPVGSAEVKRLRLWRPSDG